VGPVDQVGHDLVRPDGSAARIGDGHCPVHAPLRSERCNAGKFRADRYLRVSRAHDDVDPPTMQDSGILVNHLVANRFTAGGRDDDSRFGSGLLLVEQVTTCPEGNEEEHKRCPRRTDCAPRESQCGRWNWKGVIKDLTAWLKHISVSDTSVGTESHDLLTALRMLHWLRIAFKQQPDRERKQRRCYSSWGANSS